MNESSGLKAHTTLDPANARYTRRQMIWGGKVRRDRFSTTKPTEIAAKAGQKILVSGRDSMTLCSGVKRSNNGDTIKAKTHAEIGTIAQLSIIRLEDLG
jgi:hypothetical protein